MKGAATMNTKRILGMALLAVGAATARASVASDLWLHIKVNDDREGSKVNVNLPLSIVQAAMPVLPREASTSNAMRVGDRDLSADDLRRIWREIEKSPDTTYVAVDEGRGRVSVVKRGNYLLIHAVDSDARHERVEVKLPLPVMRALISGAGDRLDIAAALEALVREGQGELITIDGDHETVRMWIDHDSDQR
jgi:hypothetical protein